MRLEQTFEDAVASFQNFLKDNGHPMKIFWVFRDDLWRRSPTDVWVKYPSSSNSLVLAQKVFSEGCERGLVDLHAVATTANETAATVWFPKFPDQEVQGWVSGLKLSIAEPLPNATVVSPLWWGFLRFVPRFRHYQRFEWNVGTKRWAAA